MGKVSSCHQNKSVSSVPFKVINLNAQGIRGKSEEMGLLLDDQKPNIIAVTEAWLNQSEMNYYKINNNYVTADHFLRDKFQRGGVVIFKEKTLSHTKIDISNFCEEKLFEASAIKISSHNMILIACYKPPSTNFNDLYSRLELVLNSVRKYANANTLILLCGDFNLNFLGNDNSAMQLLCNLTSY